MAPGARESRGWAGILQGTLVLGGAEDGRLVGRTAVSSQTKGPRMGGNCWSRGRKVRLLLGCAQVECRPSWLLRFRYTKFGLDQRMAHRCNGALSSETKRTRLEMVWILVPLQGLNAWSALRLPCLAQRQSVTSIPSREPVCASRQG